MVMLVVVVIVRIMILKASTKRTRGQAFIFEGGITDEGAHISYALLRPPWSGGEELTQLTQPTKLHEVTELNEPN